MLNIEIEIGRLAGSALIRDYQEGRRSALTFYPGSPWDLATYRAKVADVDARFDREQRMRVAELVRATTPGAAAKLEEVVAGDGLFVTTGQQPGLFTGPLYTIYKALSAVRLADVLERALGRPVMPLFWIASDDHDWAEANHTFVLDRQNTLHRIELASTADAAPMSLRVRPLGTAIDDALADFTQRLPATEFAGPILETLRSAYRPERTVADALGELLAELLADFDLAYVDGGQPALKLAARPLLRRELECAAEHEMLLARRSGELEGAGYHAQIPVLEGSTNVFYEQDAGRERIFRDGSGFVLRHTRRRFTSDEIYSLLDSEPERFSANVALRPVVESAVFPTIAYVGGPGEISYFGQLAPLFHAYGVGMQVAFPRFGVTLVEAKIRKVLDKFDLAVDDFRQPVHELAASVVRQELPEDVVDAIGALRRQIANGYESLLRAAREIDPTLDGPLSKARNAASVQLSEVEKKIVHHVKLQSDTGMDQLEKARVNLFPNGQPQERVLNVIQYLVRFGPDLLTATAGRMEVRLEEAPAHVD